MFNWSCWTFLTLVLWKTKYRTSKTKKLVQPTYVFTSLCCIMWCFFLSRRLQFKGPVVSMLTDFHQNYSWVVLGQSIMKPDFVLIAQLDLLPTCWRHFLCLAAIGRVFCVRWQYDYQSAALMNCSSNDIVKCCKRNTGNETSRRCRVKLYFCKLKTTCLSAKGHNV